VINYRKLLIVGDLAGGFLFLESRVRCLPLSICGFKKKYSDIISEVRGNWIFRASERHTHDHVSFELNVALFEYWFPDDMIFDLFEEGGAPP